MGQDSIKNVRSFSRYEYYLLEQAMNGNCWIKLLNEGDSIEALRPLIVPGKGKPVRVYPWNRTLLRNTLVLHENKQAEIKNDTLYIDELLITKYKLQIAKNQLSHENHISLFRLSGTRRILRQVGGIR